ncbi:hypothetical protein [Microlunatus parietis]|uniref:Uncharacterized protein n=1 Tax=Microlunatus parietis TaxID=682979 RepID=A0A7Y9I770_9ACTN|nr:hypothetical protein [Microlunatus parietis]NYE71014.1 hypothetical protein [Microlunatus parietis]
MEVTLYSVRQISEERFAGPLWDGGRVEEAVEWLLGSDEPGIRLQARRDLLDQPGAEAPADILAGPKVTALLEDQRSDGSYGQRVNIRRYAGTSRSPEDLIGIDRVDLTPDVGGTLWRTLSLTELAVPPDARIQASAGFLLDATLAARPPRVIDGLARTYGFGPGGALLIATRIGLADDHAPRRSWSG